MMVASRYVNLKEDWISICECEGRLDLDKSMLRKVGSRYVNLKEGWISIFGFGFNTSMYN